VGGLRSMYIKQIDVGSKEIDDGSKEMRLTIFLGWLLAPLFS